ncbi:hypothetical protein BOTBODRAFT_190518 [Botryobasidium botryosum FD-172 SS1]|uniref:Glucose-methanol-choline oxidoreductase N-terminal domain-containing protein n=1 Tax=Botryobasidium botryosum (strain FD-172 SS1) TaxID=930990 RepID=A0A067MFN1_BOTB1|nr:hypothetical protein BOTBODRAFT_190518 [Botryobasidium botryosum FD-172 SS1]
MKRLALSLAAASQLALVLGAPPSYGFDYAHMKRGIVYDGRISDSYDFVICGGGLAGLVLASRLSQNSNYTVLVLEAGDTGDALKESIDIPGNAYYKSLLGTSADWQFNTIPQNMLQNRAIYWPRGKVLGGSTAVNGLYLVRPSAIEADTWRDLQNGADGADAWGWSNLLKAMQKSETFVPPSQDIAKAGNILYDSSSHGSSGPLRSSYPGYIVPIVGNWTATLAGAGIPTNGDANGGNGGGAFIATSSIDPSNGFARSYARSAYIDALPPRGNLNILPNATVTRIVFGGQDPGGAGLVATGVEFAASAADARKVVSVRKEVILAGGAIGSPSILFHSGVGARDILAGAGVNLVVELPGVGQHMQDHLSTEVVFNTTAPTASSILATSSQPPNFLSFVNSAIAYANTSQLLTDPGTYQSAILANLTSSTDTLVPSTDDTVKAGYRATYNAQATKLTTSSAGQIEILLSVVGSVGEAGNTGNTVSVQAALQHPFSRGHLWIASADPFQSPSIDPAYLSHPADIVLLREGLKVARRIGQTDPLRQSIIAEVTPGPTVQTDEEWENWLVGKVATQYHPSCTCSMLPRELGGVVDPKLKVYGLANVRVADSSVFPIQFAAHLMSVTYGLAEQASDIIRAAHGLPPTGSSVTDPKSGSGSGTASSGASLTSTRLSGWSSVGTSLVASVLVTLALWTL